MSLFRQHMPTMEQGLKKTQKNVKKANKKKKEKERGPQKYSKDEKTTRIDDPNVQPIHTFYFPDL